LVAPRSCAPVADAEELVGPPADPAGELIVARAFKRRAHWFYLPDRDLAYPEPRLDVGDRYTAGAFLESKGVARTLVRDAVFLLDRIPGCPVAAPEPLLTLLPGDTFSLTPGQLDSAPAPVTTAALVRRPVLWCANWFGATP
jgi:beta-mannosidase